MNCRCVCDTMIVFFLFLFLRDCRPHSTLKRSTDETSQNEVDLEKGFLINQPGCSIPPMSVFGTRVSKYVSKWPELNCEIKSGNWQPAVVYDGIDFLRVNQTALMHYGNKSEISCNYQSFRRPLPDPRRPYERIDDDKEYPSPARDLDLEIATPITAEADEFVKVTCSLKGDQQEPFYEDYFAFVPTKPEVEKRCTEFDRRTNTDRLNVAIIGLDGLSQMNFRRQMPLSASYLKLKLNAVDMLGYNKVEENTFPNLIPLLVNNTIDELTRNCWPTESSFFDECPIIWETFEKFGFRTSYVEDCAHDGLFHYPNLQGFHHQPVDYYPRPYYLEAEDNIGFEKPGFGYLCLGPRTDIDFMVNYAYKYMRKFAEKNYFGVFWIVSFSHDYLNLPQQGDAGLLQFLEKIHAENVLNKTALILMADHGLRNDDFRHTFQGRLEERLPLLTVVFPPWFRRKYAKATENFVANTRKLTTHFDLHETLLDFTNLTRLEESELDRRSSVIGTRSQSLFLPVSGDRTCAQVGIPAIHCACYDHTRPVSVTDSVVQKAAEAVERYLNDSIKNRRECPELKVTSVKSAAVQHATMGGVFPAYKQFYADYVISVITDPANGLFEATVRHDFDSNSYVVVGRVKRNGEYEKGSSCVGIPSFANSCQLNVFFFRFLFISSLLIIQFLIGMA